MTGSVLFVPNNSNKPLFMDNSSVLIAPTLSLVSPLVTSDEMRRERAALLLRSTQMSMEPPAVPQGPCLCFCLAACQPVNKVGSVKSQASIGVPPFRQTVLRHDFIVRTGANHTSHVYMNIADLVTNGIVVNELITQSRSLAGIKLSEGAQRMLNTPNAGGNSVASEVMSFELLTTMYRATLLKTEMEIDYLFWGCSITDYSVKVLDQYKLGVSVARAMKYNGVFDREDAMRLLTKKLRGVIASTENAACGKDRWSKQILHIWAEKKYVADVVYDVYQNEIDECLRANTLVIVTVCESPWIYH